jgi:hypothetical protein
LEVLFPEKKVKRILEVLFPEKKGKRILEVLFPEKKVKRILEVLFPEKTSALIEGERSSAGPILPFFIFIFPGIVPPFFRGQYFHFVVFP